MEAILDEKARDFYLTKLRSILEGGETIPALRLEYGYDRDVMHCHEAELCPMRAYLRRITEPPPQMSDRAVLTFMRGRLFERILADELPSKTKSRISGRVDGTWLDAETGVSRLIETKSTMMDMAKFNPHTSQPHWLQRSKAYCTIYDTDAIVLVAWFLVGDMWTKKTINVGLRCWELRFEEHELKKNWAYMEEQRDRLFACLEEGVEPRPEWVASRLQHYECGDCQFWDACTYPRKGRRKDVV